MKRIALLLVGMFALAALVISVSSQSQSYSFGALTATTVNKVTITQPATSATLTIPDGLTLNAGAGGTLGSNAFTSTTFAPLTSPVFVTSAISPLFRSTVAKVLLQGTGSGATQVSATQTTAPTCTTNCGSGSPTVTGTDTFMTVNLGTTPASAFVVVFNGTWAAAPSCVAQMAVAGMVVGKQPLTVVTTTGQLTVVTNGTAPSTGDKYHIHCAGTQ